MRIYVGNLSVDVTEDELRKEFQAFGKVLFVKISPDQTLDIPVSFGMVGMPVPVEAKAAIAALHMNRLKGRVLTVSEAGVPVR